MFCRYCLGKYPSDRAYRRFGFLKNDGNLHALNGQICTISYKFFHHRHFLFSVDSIYYTYEEKYITCGYKFRLNNLPQVVNSHQWFINICIRVAIALQVSKRNSLDSLNSLTDLGVEKLDYKAHSERKSLSVQLNAIPIRSMESYPTKNVKDSPVEASDVPVGQA